MTMTWSINQQYINFSLTKLESSALDLEKDFSLIILSERASYLAKDSKPVNKKTQFKPHEQTNKTDS